MSQQSRSTFVVTDPSEILAALVGLKDVRVLHYERRAGDVELMIEQVIGTVACPRCGVATKVKERPVLSYVDLPVYATPMRLAWRKYRMVCAKRDCGQGSFVLGDHRIAAKNCLLTTRAAKWATLQVGTGRTVSEVASRRGSRGTASPLWGRRRHAGRAGHHEGLAELLRTACAGVPRSGGL